MLELLCWFQSGMSKSVRVHKYRVKFFCKTKAQYVRVFEAKVSAATLKGGWGLHLDFTLELSVRCCEVTSEAKPDTGLLI